MSTRTLPQPQDPTDTRHLAILFTRARLRKGWTYLRLSTESGVSERACYRACRSGHCSSENALRLITTLGVILALPEPPKPLSAQQAQFGR